MALGRYGVSDGKGGFIPDTNIVVDECIPPLFGWLNRASPGARSTR